MFSIQYSLDVFLQVPLERRTTSRKWSVMCSSHIQTLKILHKKKRNNQESLATKCMQVASRQNYF